MTVRKAIVITHRWVSLAGAAFWIVQALTGIFAVFHWEIDDAIVAGARRPTDFLSIERSLEGRQVNSIWTSAGAPDRYDVNLSDSVLRIDGVGNVLRTRKDGERFADGGFVGTLIDLHHDLLGGARGRIVVGVTGFLLFTNLLVAVAAAWPRRGQWRRALRPVGEGSGIALLYSWHRAFGLWLVIPALLSVAAGVLLAFENGSQRLLNAESKATPQEAVSAQRHTGMAGAVSSALLRYPGSAVSGIRYPSMDNAVWTITLKQQGEWRRAYGRTRVFVSAVDGRVIDDFNVLTAPAGSRLFHSLFAFHTGEMLGMPGRIAVTLIGIWLLTMIVLGVCLWWARR
jgi:uncharacterized iron-regulated membrane protein